MEYDSTSALTQGSQRGFSNRHPGIYFLTKLKRKLSLFLPASLAAASKTSCQYLPAINFYSLNKSS